MRAAHADDNTRMGVDVVLGKAGDMSDLGIYECYRVSWAACPMNSFTRCYIVAQVKSTLLCCVKNRLHGI